eukprot:2029840-Amphidinium_carterae.1
MALRFRGINDNQGVVFALLKQYSKKMPMAAVHMEMVATCIKHQVWPELQHAKRDFNRWAD